MTRFLSFLAAAVVSTSAAACADPCDTLVQMYTLMDASTSVRIVETSPGLTITTEYQAPDRYRTVLNGHETIQIGGMGYTNLSGHWYWDYKQFQSPLEKAHLMLAYVKADRAKACSFVNPVDVGVKDGLDVIQTHDTTHGVDTVFYLRSDGFPARIEVTTRGTTYVTAYSDWNAPIVIEKP